MEPGGRGLRVRGHHTSVWSATTRPSAVSSLLWRAQGGNRDHRSGMWRQFAACARTEWSSLPWSDDASKRDVDRMRWVCVNVCPSRVGCERYVEDDLTAGRVIAGFRAGVSARARTRRLASDSKPNPRVP